MPTNITPAHTPKKKPTIIQTIKSKLFTASRYIRREFSARNLRTAVIIAVSLPLLSASLTYAVTIYLPSQGGTGTGVTPQYGQVLMGNGSGTYTPVSTSSLGISSGSNFSTTSANFWSLAGLGFSTTSTDYWLTTKSLSAFATTSANYWASLGLGFSTTSTDYWKTQNNFFSTTSANFWSSVGLGYSTTSENYYLQSSTTVPKTYTANTYTLAQTFGVAPILSTITGLVKGNGASAVTAAVNGTDFTLITLSTCSAGLAHVAVTAAGAFTCGNAFSTTSASYFSSVGLAFSTTSSNYHASVGLSFSTTSASYFLSQNIGNAFSTTSANYWSSAGLGFSTTSANFWSSAGLGFSTTSQNYYLQASTTVPKTYTANTYALTQTDTLAPVFSSLTGVLKGNGASALTIGVDGTDFTLINALTCNSGDFVSAVNAAGVFTCTTPAGGSSFSTTSASYFASVGLAYSTTSTLADLTTYNKGFFFSTTSALAHLTSLDKGFFFSTTSANNWSSLGLGFSTTSANFWSAAGLGHSTTSVAYQLSLNTIQGNSTSTTIFATTASTSRLFANSASTSIFSANTICFTADTCRTTWPTGSGGGSTDKWATTTDTTVITPNSGVTTGVIVAASSTLRLLNATAATSSEFIWKGSTQNWKSIVYPSGTFVMASSSATTGATSSATAAFSIANGPFGARVGIGTDAPRTTLDLYEQVGSGISPGIMMGGNTGGDTNAWQGRRSDNDGASNDFMAWGGGDTVGTNEWLTLNLVNGNFGVGSTTPWALLSVIRDGDNSSRPLLLMGSSTNTFFGIIATTSIYSATSIGSTNIPVSDNGVRVFVGPWNPTTHIGYGSPLDTFEVNGTIGTPGWARYTCNGIGTQVTTVVSDLTQACGEFAFEEDTTAQYNSGVLQIPGASTNDGAALMVGVAGTGPFTFGVSTPRMEGVVSLNATGATSTVVYFGLVNKDLTSSTFESVAGLAGCYWTASSTQMNWQAVCIGGTSPIQADSGIGSTTKVRLRVEGDANTAAFYIRSAASGGLAKILTATSANIPTGNMNAAVFFSNVQASASTRQLTVGTVELWVRAPDGI